MAKPRKSKPAKPKEHAFTPDERITERTGPSAEPAYVPIGATCPRASVCLHAEDCIQEPDGCGAFTRQEAQHPPQSPQGRSDDDGHQVVTNVGMVGNDIGKLSAHELLARLAEAREAREDREGAGRYPGLDPRSLYRRNKL